jgi:FkbM family methyltransferase
VKDMLRKMRNRALSKALSALLRPTLQPGLIRLGSGYGGWWVPHDAVGPGTVAYCAGAGEDITFDLAVHERGGQVTTFDPTPRAVAYVEQVAPESSRFRFVPLGWGRQEGEVRFYAPRDPAHVSHSTVNLQGTSEFFTARVKPVRSFMTDLGDEKVDLIKMDIEGAEYDVLDTLLQVGPRPRVLCVEFDQPQPLRRTLAAVRSLRNAGYMLAKVEQWNCTFVQQAAPE